MLSANVFQFLVPSVIGLIAMDDKKEDSTATKAETFLHKLNGIVKSGFTSLGLALGSNLGLFKMLCNFKQPASSKNIAEASGCKERYVDNRVHYLQKY